MILFVANPQNIEAGSESRDIRLLLESINQRLSTTSDFSVDFQFAVPLIVGDDPFWLIPYNGESGDIIRYISEIGDNYVCFGDQDGAGFITTRCTPYSNIVSITYSEP